MTKEEMRAEAIKLLEIANKRNAPICDVIDDIYGFLYISERYQLLEEVIVLLSGFCTVGWYDKKKNS